MKVIKKQTNSKLCFICGIDNPYGLVAPFYEMEDETVISLFKYQNIHQSYPGRVHGGLISAMLDEIAGRAIWITEPNTWAVTTQLNVKYRKPVPYDTPLKAKGQITRNTRRIFEAHSEILDMDGNVLAEAEVVYFKQPINVIATEGTEEDINILIPDEITEIN